VLAAVEHGHHAANADATDAALKPDHRLQGGVGFHHGLAEGGKVVVELGGLVNAEKGSGRRQMELELLNSIFLLQFGELGNELGG
jgi:hypothetical protein